MKHIKEVIAALEKIPEDSNILNDISPYAIDLLRSIGFIESRVPDNRCLYEGKSGGEKLYYKLQASLLTYYILSPKAVLFIGKYGAKKAVKRAIQQQFDTISLWKRMRDWSWGWVAFAAGLFGILATLYEFHNRLGWWFFGL
jgi:hypothetical protein